MLKKQLHIKSVFLLDMGYRVDTAQNFEDIHFKASINPRETKIYLQTEIQYEYENKSIEIIRTVTQIPYN